MKETDLYNPIKVFFEAKGYEVKAEVTDCDVVALKKDEEPIIIELKNWQYGRISFWVDFNNIYVHFGLILKI